MGTLSHQAREGSPSRQPQSLNSWLPNRMRNKAKVLQLVVNVWVLQSLMARQAGFVTGDRNSLAREPCTRVMLRVMMRVYQTQLSIRPSILMLAVITYSLLATFLSV